MKMRYVIVGSGVAGISAVESIRSMDPEGEITVVYDDPYGYYSRPAMAYYLTGELTEKEMYPFKEEQYRRLRVNWVKVLAKKLDTQSRFLEIETGAKIPYDKLLIATGAMAALPKIPGIELEGVVKVDGMEDTKKFLHLEKRVRSAVVIGGGITSLEIVEGFLSHRIKVHYIIRAAHFWDAVLDTLESGMVEHTLIKEGVVIHPLTEVIEIIGKNGKVVGVRTKYGETIKCQMVAVAIGVQPRKDLAVQAGLKTDRGVLVNEYLQTSNPDIYVAGDVAQVFDPLTGKATLDVLWNIARSQGTIAGLNMVGKPTRYLKSLPFNVTRLAGITTTILGTVGQGKEVDSVIISRGDSETWRHLPDAVVAERGDEFNHLRLVIGKNELLGALVMGEQTISRPLQDLMTAHVDITPIREELMKLDAHLDLIIINFWQTWREKGGFIEKAE
jgi:NAD(P)H-nitrite reductase large subunit